MSSSTVQQDILTHAKRVYKWRLNQVDPTDSENRRLDEAGVPPHNATMRGYMAWRHTSLCLALPIVLFGAIWDLVVMGQTFNTDSTRDLNGMGSFVLRVPYFSSLFLFVALLLCVVWWNQWRRTRTIVRIGWSLSFFLPFLPALFPLESLLKKDYLLYYRQNDMLLVYKFGMALSYVFVVLPLIITFPGGAVRAAIRLRGLLPQSSLSSWILVISAPFYSLIILLSLVVVIQLAGNWLLVLGAVILTVNPWIYVVFRRLYVTSGIDDKLEARVDVVQKVAGLSSMVGFVMVLVWALSSGVIGSIFSVGQLVTFLFRGFGNGLVTSIVFCDSFLRMTVSNWRNDRDRRDNDGGVGIDAMFSAIEQVIRKPKMSGGGGDDDTAHPDSTASVGEDVEAGTVMTSDTKNSPSVVMKGDTTNITLDNRNERHTPGKFRQEDQKVSAFAVIGES
jgi:hypothetical protein